MLPLLSRIILLHFPDKWENFLILYSSGHKYSTAAAACYVVSSKTMHQFCLVIDKKNAEYKCLNKI